MKARQKPALKRQVFSPRSQRSMLKQLGLEAEQAKTRELIAFAEKKIAQGKETSKNQARTLVGGGSYAIHQALDQTLADIANREREITAYREHNLALQAEIEALALTSEQTTERAAHQAALRALCLERLEKDRQADSLLQLLREMLLERATLTGRMLECAAKVDFAPDADFDDARFAALDRSLPAEVAGTSREWVNWFLGRDTPRDPYVITSKVAVLPETLANAHVYRHGDTAFLTKGQAAKLPAEDAPKSLPTPADMEASVASTASVLPAGNKPDDDSFPVSCFIRG